METMLIVFLQLAATFLLFAFYAMGPRKSCPVCEKPLPRLQSPFAKTKRQWLEGGYRCQQCGCETDLAGMKAVAGSAPSLRSYIVGAGLLAVTATPAVVLLTMLVRR